MINDFKMEEKREIRIQMKNTQCWDVFQNRLNNYANYTKSKTRYWQK